MFDLKHIIAKKKLPIRHFMINEPIFKEGEKIEGVYFIKKGKVKVTKSGKSNMALWFAAPNEFIGLNSFFSNSDCYSFSTFAYGGNTDLLFIPSHEFMQLLDKYPAFKQEIIKVLCNRITYTRNRISTVKSQSIRKRFLKTILLFINKEDLHKASVKIKYSIDELSELTGSSRQYIQKLIREFHHEKLLQLNTNNSMVINMNQLLANIN